MLSSDQTSFFGTFGYLVFRRLFSAQEMTVIGRRSRPSTKVSNCSDLRGRTTCSR